MSRARRAMGVAILASLVTLLTVATAERRAAAADPDNEPRPWLAQTAEKPVATASETPVRPLRMWVIAFATVALAGGAIYARYRKKGPLVAKSTRLNVVSSVRVGPKANLVMVAVGGRTMLLGVTDDSVRRLGWLPAAAAEEPAKKAAAPASPFSEEEDSFFDAPPAAAADENEDHDERKDLAIPGEAARPFTHVLRSVFGTQERDGKSPSGERPVLGAASLIARDAPADRVEWTRRKAPARREPEPIAHAPRSASGMAPAPARVGDGAGAATESQASGLKRKRTRKPA